MQQANLSHKFGTVLRDLRTGYRSIRKAPGFALAVILTAAMGVGANTAVFSVVHAVLLSPPPYPHGERLTEIWEATSGQQLPVSWINFQHWRNENHTFDEMAGFETADLTLSGRGDAVLIHAGVVTSSFFRLMGWRPAAGRLFNAEDDRPGAAPTVLVSSEFQARMRNNDPQSVGTSLTLDGKAYQIAGILPPGLRFFAQQIDIYIPAGLRDGNATNRAEHGSMVVLGLLKPGLKRLVAQADLDAIMRRLALSDVGPESDHLTEVAWLAEFGAAEVRPTLLTLMAAAGLVLVIACANIAGLLLLRGTTRMREIAIRSAIGATRGQLARHILTENLLIVAFGGGMGLILAGICVRALLLVGPQDIPRIWDSSLNLPVLSFSVIVTVITGLLAGLAPWFHFDRLDLPMALREGSAGAGNRKRGQSLRSGLIVTEIALTLVLTFTCGLLLRSLIAAQRYYPGFTAEHVLAVELQLPPSEYRTEEAMRQFYARFLRDLRREPGVESVGAVNCPPSTGGCAKGWYSIADMPSPARANVPLTLLTRVDGGYFRTTRIPLLAGRSFNDLDRDGGSEAVVNEKLARRWWPEAPQLAVGHHIKFGGPYMEGPTLDIVGVVGDVKQAALDEKSLPEVYVKGVERGMVVMVRAAGDPVGLIPTVRRELTSLDRNVPIVSIQPFSLRMAATLQRRRFTTLLLGIFAALAVALTSIGIYGVFNYWVRTRQKEIAIRMALGARRSELLQWTGWHMLRIVALGLALGTFGCWCASRSLKSMVFGISAGNPLTFLAASGAVVAMAVLVAIIPVWGAARIDPIRHLHE